MFINLFYSATHNTVPSELLDRAVESIPHIDSREALNMPTGNFFHDPWKIKPEYKDTVWEELLATLDSKHGEARLIKLAPGQCYSKHADIDDRFHLGLTGTDSFLINLEENEMHLLEQDGRWYEMNAARRHTAANFGCTDRVQLVVRKLLPTSNITEPVNIKITLIEEVFDRRFIFDDTLSPWINYAFKRQVIENFHGEDLKATMTVDKSVLTELEQIINNSGKFKMEVNYEK
jgi:hypothetical protein